MIYITGDCHGDWSRFSTEVFPEQKEMTRDDYVIVCGDFGIWHDTPSERWWLDWLSKKPFTLVFVDGNHENHYRLFSGEFPEVDFHGGKAHKIRENVYHLERGYVFELDRKKFFAFGGASSHDIDDGILDEKDFQTYDEFKEVFRHMQKQRKMFRVNHISWWKEELPSDEEMDRGLESLERANWKVDFVILHCPPQTVNAIISNGAYKSDRLTLYFNGLIDRGLRFDRWIFGHLHDDKVIMSKFILLYEQIIRIN